MVVCLCVCVCVCVYVCVCVCVCVCVDCYSCSRMNQVQVRVSSHGLLICGFVDLQNNASFSSYAYSFAYLECHCSLFRRARSQTCLPSVARSTLLSS